MKKPPEIARLTQVERAIILLAGYLEDPNHSDYRVRDHVIEVLGYEPLTKEQKKQMRKI